jgi:hypothetical protein
VGYDSSVTTSRYLGTDSIRSSQKGEGTALVKCFVIMPISMLDIYADRYNDSDHFEHVLNYLFRPALEAAGYETVPPAAVGTDVIHAEIIRNLETCDMVLCDISTLNPNVFFELGIRTSLDRPAILVRDNFTAQIPFDTGSINSHTYDASLQPWKLPSEVEALTLHIQNSVAKSGDRNALWRYFGLTQRATPAEIRNPLEAKLDLLIDEVTRLSTNSEAMPRVSDASDPSLGDLQYEYELRATIRTLGYEAKSSRAVPGGFDLIVEDADHRIVVVELKHSRVLVTRAAIDSIMLRASRTQVPVCLITNSSLTRAAQQAIASFGGLEVVQWRDHDDDDRLAETLHRMFGLNSGSPRTDP